MRKKTLVFIWIACLFAAMSFAANKKFTLVIDAGHGGHDAGALGSFSKEKNINLNVALAFGRYVENNCPDVKVIYTRKTDVFIPLHTRANIANKNKADLFISIHTNALPKKRIARGLETYTLGMHRASDNLDVAKRENSVILIEKDYKQHYEGFDPNSSESYIMFEFMQDKNMAQSVELAKSVQKRVCASAGRANKGVKQAGFLVLRATSMPSCLIELGFITTPDEERYLNSQDGIDKLGYGIYQAFLDYKKKYQTGIVVPYQPERSEEVSIPTIVPQDEQQEEQPKKKKRKSKVAQELADARSGENIVDLTPEPVAVNADSIVEANPIVETPKETTAVETPQEQTVTIPVKTQREPAVPARTEDVVKPAKNKVETREMPTVEKPVTPKVETPAAPVAKKKSVPVFKVQILASANRQSANSPLLKGQKDTEMYEENGMYKYTVGASEDLNEMRRLRRTLLEKFPEAFIIAFKDGKRMDIHEAMREFSARKK